MHIFSHEILQRLTFQLEHVEAAHTVHQKPMKGCVALLNPASDSTIGANALL